MMADHDDMLVLGGAARPTGCTVAFVECPADGVRQAIDEIRRAQSVESTGPMPFSTALGHLDPMEAPWTTEIVVDCGRWTSYLNNARSGGDPTAIAPALARQLGVRCVTAMHLPRHGPGHESTQLLIEGPTGRPPLMEIRSLAADCADGRWSWHESGDLQPFEQPERYTTRRTRDRFDRPLLVAYLSAMGIEVTDPAFFGESVVIRRLVDWEVRTESVSAFRAANGWA